VLKPKLVVATVLLGALCLAAGCDGGSKTPPSMSTPTPGQPGYLTPGQPIGSPLQPGGLPGGGSIGGMQVPAGGR
jgi:hypothetical protein